MNLTCGARSSRDILSAGMAAVFNRTHAVVFNTSSMTAGQRIFTTPVRCEYRKSATAASPTSGNWNIIENSRPRDECNCCRVSGGRWMDTAKSEWSVRPSSAHLHVITCWAARSLEINDRQWQTTHTHRDTLLYASDLYVSHLQWLTQARLPEICHHAGVELASD